MRNVLILFFMLVLLAGVSQATSILWVSDCWTETVPLDQGFLDLLEDYGYTVDRMDNPQTMDAAAQTVANGYDLVIVGRRASSGDYNNTGEKGFWNGITAPLIQSNFYLTRSSRWEWINNGSTVTTSLNMAVILPNDPVFAGVTLDENNSVDILSQGGVTLNPTLDAGNGTLVGVRDYEGQEYPWIVRWETGQEYYAGAGEYASGPRMAFSFGESGGTGDGTYNLTGQGKMVFLNAVYEMSGNTAPRPPVVNANVDQVIYSLATSISGSVIELENSPITSLWTSSDPNVTTFVEATALDTTVTFDVPGTYRLRLTVTKEGVADQSDTMTVHAVNTAGFAKIAHWDFESLADSNSLTDITGNGFTGISKEVSYPTLGVNPYITAGHISATAADCNDLFFWEIPNLKRPEDPNFNDLKYGATFAVWVKADAVGSTKYPVIIGDNAVGLGVHEGVFTLRALGLPGSDDLPDDTKGSRAAYDSQWHHVVGVFDGANSEAILYVDGVVDANEVFPSGTLLSIDDELVQIASRPSLRYWYGQIDDIQVYNYPLSESEVAVLAAEGDLIPYLLAGPDQEINFKGDPIQLDGSLLVDDGIPAYVTLEWTLDEYPATVTDVSDIVISDTGIENPVVTLTGSALVSGDFSFRLTGDDTVKQSSDAMVVRISIPTCEDVILDGLTSYFDVAGGLEDFEGNPTPDCYVNLLDFVEFAKEWLDCVNPEDSTCLWPY